MVAIGTQPTTVETLKLAFEQADFIEIPASIDTFWQLIELPDYRLEYVNKHIIGTMSYGSTPHETIVSNVVFELRTAFNEVGFRVFASNRPVFAAACEEVYMPDVHLVVGTLQEYHYDKTKTASLNPTVVVEVHSKTTRNYDLSEKLDCYKAMPTVQQIVYIESQQPRLRVFSRTNKPEQWLEMMYKEPMLKAKILNRHFSLSKIYRDVSF